MEISLDPKGNTFPSTSDCLRLCVERGTKLNAVYTYIIFLSNALCYLFVELNTNTKSLKLCLVTNSIVSPLHCIVEFVLSPTPVAK